MAGLAPVSWQLVRTTLTTEDHTLVMGIVNVTPDSFSDGGVFVATDGETDHPAAIRHGLRLWGDGADIVDVGGESTRPGSHGISEAEELDRVLPVVAALAEESVVVSVDTSRPAVAAAALGAGAEAVNDVTALRNEGMARLCADRDAGVVVLHMQGEPRTMQADPVYDDVVADVRDELQDAISRGTAAGIEPARICIDPGIGFGKTHAHNLDLLARLEVFTRLGHAVMVGASRKGSLGLILEDAGYPAAAKDRDPATGATVALAVAAGVAVLRVHNVAAAVQSARTADAIVRVSPGD